MRNIAILTSGGDSQGMNAAVRATALTAMSKGLKVYGIMRGYKGMLDDDIFEITHQMLEGISSRGGTILKSARLPEFKDPKVRELAAKNLKKRDIDGLVVIGGDGSFHGAHYLYEEQGIKTIGLPGTIDNDIAGTDFTIGYDTALNIIVDAVEKLRDTSYSHDRTTFVEVMGRNCGDLALNASLATGSNGVMIPEQTTTIEDIVNIILKRRELGFTHNVIIVAEGVGNTQEIANQVEKIIPDNVYKVCVLGHIQRGGTPTAKDRILATRMGSYAVNLLLEGKAGLMVGIEKNELITHKLSYAWENYSKKDQESFKLAMELGI